MGGASGVKDLVFRAYRAGARTVSVHVTSLPTYTLRIRLMLHRPHRCSSVPRRPRWNVPSCKTKMVDVGYCYLQPMSSMRHK
jgi:hypothetical protein